MKNFLLKLFPKTLVTTQVVCNRWYVTNYVFNGRGGIKDLKVWMRQRFVRLTVSCGITLSKEVLFKEDIPIALAFPKDWKSGAPKWMHDEANKTTNEFEAKQERKK